MILHVVKMDPLIRRESSAIQDCSLSMEHRVQAGL